MVGNFVKRSVLVIPIFLLALLFIFPQGSGIYIPTIIFDVPLEDSQMQNDIGLFVRNESMDLDFNFTFDYPLPLGEDESLITAEIWRGAELVETKTIPLKEYLEMHKVVNNDRYIFKPIFFNYSVGVMAVNATYSPIEFTYNVNQYRRTPYEGEDDKNWKVQGRVIQDQKGGQLINNNYCSGPWDFNDGSRVVTAETCDNYAGVDCILSGKPCSNNDQCCSNICEGNLCVLGSCAGTICGVNEFCCEYPNYCDNGKCRIVTPEKSFVAGTKIQLAENTENIENIKVGDTVLSFKDNEIIERDVLSVVPAHSSDHYYLVGTANREVRVTGNHMFHTPEGFIEVSSLNIGDYVYVLDNGKLGTEKITIKNYIPGDILVYDFEVDDSHTYFANGFAVHNDPIRIVRGAWDEKNGNNWWTSPIQENTILYFEVGDSFNIKDTPVPIPQITDLEWASAHSWKFETYVLPTQNIIGTMEYKMYPDDGSRFFYYRLVGNEWVKQPQDYNCLVLSSDSSNPSSAGCTFNMALAKNNWYKLEFYLYNNPWGRTAGEEDDNTGETNPFGLRVENSQSRSNSLSKVLGTGSFISSVPPGDDGVSISGSGTIYANQGLAEIRDFSIFSTSHRNPGCSGSVICSMRAACGNSEYKPYANEPGLTTNKYGWILHHNIYPGSWDNVGGISTKKTGYITTTGSSSGKPINFDTSSITNARNTYTNLIYGAYQNIGGIYRCSSEWPSWQYDCANADNRYSYQKGSETVKCCYVAPAVGPEEDQKVTIDYYSGYDYIINFLPPYGTHGDKLCVAAKNTGFLNVPEELYKSEYTNEFCDEDTGKGCCYCRPGWGCSLDCINELNMTGGEFSLPFPSSGAFWELKNVNLNLESTKSPLVINLSSTGNEKTGWEISAALGEAAEEVLDKNYTIPFNLFEDFGINVPEERGVYNLIIKVNYTTKSGERYVVPSQYMFSAVDCVKDGEMGSYYDKKTYPSTYGKGACKAGTRECVKLTDIDYRWQYDTTAEMPVYPTTEKCNGVDDDCNGIVDDINSFDWIIDQIIASGGKNTPYGVTQCGCFMGASSNVEICNGIDDDCNGVVDDPSVSLWVNTCDNAVMECINEGSPYDWCRHLYNSSQCGLEEIKIESKTQYTINTCTKTVRECMNNIDIAYMGDDYVLRENMTYDDCKQAYENYTCFLDTRTYKALGNTCRCTSSTPINETCNGIDDDCNGIIDDVESVDTCECALLDDIAMISELKNSGDTSCDGSDSDCDGKIDDDAIDCACTKRTPSEVMQIKETVTEICDGIDNDCDGVKDENFPSAGKPCGYGVCGGGNYVCNVHGDEAVCNTTVNPEETFSGLALKLSDNEICDLKDNDCDYSIDEDCLCTPLNSVKLCGYQSGIYYKDREQLDQTCEDVITQLKELITWSEAPDNAQYRRTLTVKNTGTKNLMDYPVNVTLNTAFYAQEGKMRTDGGDLRIYEAGEEKHIPWVNSTPFSRSRTNVWFKTDILAGQEKNYYLYYGNPVATYNPPEMSSVVGLTYGKGVFLLCHFDNTTDCEGNMVPSYNEGVTFNWDTRELLGYSMNVQSANINGIDKLSYPTSENFNKNRGTIAMWFKPSDLLADHYLFYSEDLEGEPQFTLHLNENGTLFDAFDSLDVNHTVNGGIVNTEWHHLAVTWDNLNGIKIYIDGELKDSKNVAWQSDDIGINVYVGSDGSSNTAYSLIDEFAVYSEPLTGDEIKEIMRYYVLSSSLGQEETMDNSVAQEDDAIYERCNSMLQNVTFTGDDEMNTVLSLCDSVRICEKTDFAIDAISECTFGTQTCVAGEWDDCTGVEPVTEICNMKDDDCNTIIDDVAFPETCACSNGGVPGVEICNGIDDDCNGVIDDVRGGDSKEVTHCGCFEEIVNITQKNAESDILCNGIDDNCDGIIDEDIENCACNGALFTPTQNTWSTSIGIETCNAKDDDCNGVIDDDWQQQDSGIRSYEYLGGTCSPVNSRCVGGVYVCSNNKIDIVCSTSSNDGISGEDLRMNETCNGIDDDCNGVIDDVWGEISYKFCQCYNGLPATEEKCDGIDNDCDGFIDNGIGNCGCSFDIEVSSDEINQLAVLLNTKKSSGELCNNVDDDCNGIVDDDIAGECFCSGGFSGNPAARPEFCNGIDDNCDGVIDDVAFPETCSCFESENLPHDLNELCDGIDNDCNGLIDENWKVLGSTCGMGMCEGGIYECSAEQDDVICSTVLGGSDEKATDEVCGDELDNDCNTLIDENCVCDVDGETKKCSTNEGECVEGIQTCSGGEWSSCIGGVLGQPESCDGLDNDCNGIIDDIDGCGCYGGSEAGVEICNGIDDDCNGIIDDISHKSSVEATKCGCYNGLYGRGAQLEICNMIDDDCDGIIDNVKDGESVPATRCACYAGASPSVESCNKIDDDCDGKIDEDWPTVGETCGLGICTGEYVCSDDGKTVLCNGASPVTEKCDSKDNDCDGKIDEGCTEGIGVGSSCENGIQDGDEQGVDCGGLCPVPCGNAVPIGGATGTWMMVFAALVIVIIGVGVIMVYFK